VRTDGASTNLASVWYRLTAAAAGRVVVERGRRLRHVLSAWSGPCDALQEVACNDDGPRVVQSRIDLDLVAGATVLVEATAFRNTMPRTLRIAFRRGCAAEGAPCDDGDPCSTGDVCADGICQGPTATCDDANPCTADVCGPAGECAHEAATVACDDGDVCTVGDVCAEASCRTGARVVRLGSPRRSTSCRSRAGSARPRARVLGHRLARASTSGAGAAATAPRRRRRSTACASCCAA
jgi:hypothetical protein